MPKKPTNRRNLSIKIPHYVFFFVNFCCSLNKKVYIFIMIMRATISNFHSVVKMFVLTTLLCYVLTDANAQTVTVSNNLLYDAFLTPNLRIGARLAPHWSVGMTAG